MAATMENDRTPPPAGLAEPAQLQEELRRERDMHHRALADFDNYRRRIERERAGAAQSGKLDMVTQLLDLVDSFDRALQHGGEAPAAWREGIQSIHRKLLGLLEAQGVKAFESVGQPFDPAVHEAIGAVESEIHEPGLVAEEVQRGYRWGDTLLRPARVRVAG